ncbi:MAG: dTMP kinase [Micropepsaceae bacterium]
MSKNAFITFEGGEGAGKTTQIRLLADHLRKAGRDVVQTREPGGSPAAEEVRQLLVTGAAERWSPLAETLLFYAARVEHWREVIEPALQRGAVVLCDRFADSTMAYQAYAGGLPLAVLKQLHDLVLPGVEPDMTVVLDLPVSEGLKRAADRPGVETRFEGKGTQFHEKLRSGFLEIAKQNPARCIVLDGRAGISSVHQLVVAAVKSRLNLG